MGIPIHRVYRLSLVKHSWRPFLCTIVPFLYFFQVCLSMATPYSLIHLQVKTMCYLAYGGFTLLPTILWSTISRAVFLEHLYRISTTYVSTYPTPTTYLFTVLEYILSRCPKTSSKHSNETDPGITLEAYHHLPPTDHIWPMRLS